MPCWNIITMQVNIGVIHSKDRFRQVAEKLGWSVSQYGEVITLRKWDTTITIRGENAEVKGPEGTQVVKLVNELKAEYSAQTVIDGAKKFGWKVQPNTQPTKANKRKIVLMR